MELTTPQRRGLGTMVAYGFRGLDLRVDLDVAARLGATFLEVLPEWSSLPDPRILASAVSDRGFCLHSAHGCWGGQTIRAARVDLGSTVEEIHRTSVEDLARCADWLHEAGGRYLVVHPGGLSDRKDQAAREDALGRGLLQLADHVRDTGLMVCVENMPRGVFPGSRMEDLARLLQALARPELALTVDTGHAQMTSSPSGETLASRGFLATTHVHDNDGRQDSHLPPGAGVIDWSEWGRSLDEVAYLGPIVLECIRHLRKHPESVNESFLEALELVRTVRDGPTKPSGF